MKIEKMSHKKSFPLPGKLFLNGSILIDDKITKGDSYRLFNGKAGKDGISEFDFLKP